MALNNKKTALYGLGVILSVFCVLTLNNAQFGNFFLANSLNSIKHAPFDGAVYPYTAAPDWVNLTEEERKMSFSELPKSKILAPPLYNPAELSMPVDELGFSSDKDIRIRNAKITYSVPYLGNYELDGHENAGSHPAVDVKLPIGTPIVSIMNGVVVKAEDQPWGFGKHVVIRHNEVPSLENESELTTYISSYSHMYSYNVAVGDVVTKGQLIGYSGDTGTATTPHLHFQIDTDDSPWSPYWPFTATEAKNAGMNTFEAINAGLGIDIAKKMTINPLRYVQKYYGKQESPVESIEESVEQESEESTDTVEKADEDRSIPEQEYSIPEVESDTNYVEETTTIDSSIIDEVSLNVSPVVLLGQASNVELRLGNDLSNSFAAADFEDVSLSSTLKIGSSTPVVASSNTQTVLLPFVPREVGYMNLKVNINGEEVSTGNVEVRTFADVSVDDADNYKFLYLKNNSVFTGDSEGNFNPNNSVNRAEAVKIVLQALKNHRFEVVRSEPDFSDVAANVWFADPVSRAFKYGIVNGVSSSEFKPTKTVTLAEFLKMYFTALRVDIDPVVHESYSSYFDTNAWYAKYLVEAINRNVIDSNTAMSPNSTLSRRDVAQIVYRIMKMSENGADRFEY